MARYRPKTVEIEAVQFDGSAESITEISDLVGETVHVKFDGEEAPTIKVGSFTAKIGWWVVKTPDRKILAWPDAQFGPHYELVEDGAVVGAFAEGGD